LSRNAYPALTSHGLVDHTKNRAVIFQQRYQDTERWPPGDERPCTVDGIQHPAQRSVGPIQAKFLPQNTMIGEALTQYCPHSLFGGTIGDRDRRLIGFRIGGDAGPEERSDDRPSDIRGSFRRRDQLWKIQAQGSGTGVFDSVRR
jgi:hypothetical protein